MTNRNNVNVARQLRDAERGQRLNASRKAVTASKGSIASASVQAEAAARAAESNDKYQQTLDKLNSFRKQHHQKAKVSRHKLDWLEEYNQLKKQLQEASQAADKSFADLLSGRDSQLIIGTHIAKKTVSSGSSKERLGQRKSSLAALIESKEEDDGLDSKKESVDAEQKPDFSMLNNDIADEVSELVSEINKLDADRVVMTRSIISEIRELRGILDVISAKQKQEADSAQSDTSQWFFSTSSNVAQFLVQVRNSQTKLAQDLKEQEQDLTAQIAHHQDTVLQLSKEESNVSSTFDEELKRLLGDAWEDVDPETTAPEILFARMEIENKLMLNKDSFSNQVQVIEEAFKKDAAAIDAAGSLECALDPNGGWSEEDHFKFDSILKAARQNHRGRNITVERLQLEFPNKTAQELACHEKWYTLQRMQTTKKKDAQAILERQTKELVGWAQSMLAKINEDLVAEAARKDFLEEQRKARDTLNERLQLLKEERREKEERENAEKAELDAKKEAHELQTRERQQEEERKRKEAIAAYRQKEAEHQAILKAREEERKVLEAEEKKVQLEKAKVRTDFREAERQKKIQQQLEAQKDAEEREKVRMELLEKIAAQVPYYDRLQEIEADLSKHTVFTQNNIFSEADKARGFHPLYGFTDQKVFSDIRFKIGIALREAGVAQSAYAASLVSQMAPRAQAPFAQHL